ncbi:CemA family protein (plasmid) [Brasilonema octagenarum UFV-E1]|uniref:Proton extrusion protein PxcA n=2 Tax=Brasilonema TaxID=383614 RepID=A0A856MQL3_9CYAN|nr:MULTISPECIES: CemA family protein [Brasilonema]NMF61656.1 CemA family protein [Brasilonema octagenarum UFV-OR1]QDL12594.1 CemA family protein [Brasilonema sennae CENA114]QDL18989.1 CemA family protein [Brasilonema octagenarum UFV-E1]
MKSRLPSKKNSIIPRSILRTIDKFKQTLDPNAESKVIEEFRASRYQTISSIRFLLILIVVPLLVNQLSRNFVISPLVKNFWNQEKVEIFLNASQQEKALAELKRFEQVLNFEARIGKIPKLSAEVVQNKLKEKANTIAEEYKAESINAVTNIFADILTAITFIVLIFKGQKQLSILKSFAGDTTYSLSDSAKAFLIILSTDIFVGYHSPYGWEIILESTLKHYGFPENKSFISLFIATVPVIMDTIFKYWIFRYLNRSFPSAVATYRNMNE